MTGQPETEGLWENLRPSQYALWRYGARNRVVVSINMRVRPDVVLLGGYAYIGSELCDAGTACRYVNSGGLRVIGHIALNKREEGCGVNIHHSCLLVADFRTIPVSDDDNRGICRDIQAADKPQLLRYFSTCSSA